MRGAIAFVAESEEVHFLLSSQFIIFVMFDFSLFRTVRARSGRSAENWIANGSVSDGTDLQSKERVRAKVRGEPTRFSMIVNVKERDVLMTFLVDIIVPIRKVVNTVVRTGHQVRVHENRMESTKDEATAAMGWQVGNRSDPTFDSQANNELRRRTVEAGHVVDCSG